MSFKHYARKVHNPDLPMVTRASALRSCIRMLSTLTNENFVQAVARFDNRFHFNWDVMISAEPPAESTLIAALLAVEAERNSLLEEMRISDLGRKAAKIRRRTSSSG